MFRNLVFPVSLLNNNTVWFEIWPISLQPAPPQGSAFYDDISGIDPSRQSFILLYCFLFPFFFMMKHLWSCLSGLSSQFSPTRRRYQWLICMWTGAFTSILIETVVACCCVACFPCTHRGAVKNWRRRQICYPYVALRRPLKQHPFMYNRETLKIIASFLSILSLSLFLSQAHTQTLAAPLKKRSSNYYMEFFSASARFLLWSQKKKEKRKIGREIYLSFLINDVYW